MTYRLNSLIELTDREDTLDGGGISAQEFFVENIDWTLHQNCLEMFAGHGCIGNALFEQGIVENVAYADINPEAVEFCSTNYPDSQVYQSNCFDNVQGQYDLIIGNPPWYNIMPYAYTYQTIIKHIDTLKAVDKDWNIHKKFFNQAIDYLTDDGIIILIESAFGTNEKVFEPMAHEAGLELYHHEFAGLVYDFEPTYFCYYRKIK